MGLHISSLAQISEVDLGDTSVTYFVYFLNYYQFSDEIVDSFLKELPTLETHFRKLGNAVIITSIQNLDFYSDVISWHNVAGVDPKKFGPCILICDMPPSKFKSKNLEYCTPSTVGTNTPWIILPLHEICETASDLSKLLQRIVEAISKNTPLKEFGLDELYLYKKRPVITGKARIGGIEFDFRSAFNKVKSKLKK